MLGRVIVAGLIVVTSLSALRGFWSEWRGRPVTDPHRAAETAIAGLVRLALVLIGAVALLDRPKVVVAPHLRRFPGLLAELKGAGVPGAGRPDDDARTSRGSGGPA